MNSSKKYYWPIIIVFVLLALSFVLDMWGKPIKIKQNPTVDSKFLSHDTVRDPLVHGAKIEQAGFKYNCNECHAYLQPPETPKKLIGAHQHIVLKHGINDNCFKCHHRTKRESLVDIYGTEVPFKQSAQLCQKCHGPKYRDWKAGVHGRPSGYWDKTKGETIKPTCAACHNPHAPKFQPIEPAPAPAGNH